MPARIAAIDVGATSVRMRMIELGPDGARRILEDVVHPIALGVDTFGGGFVRPGTFRALGKVLANFRRVLEEHGVTTWQAVATSAIRDATNRDVIVDRLFHASGIRLRVLEAVEESWITYRALLPFLRENGVTRGGNTLVFDLGGGSTEVMLLGGEHVALAASRRLGLVRLLAGISSEEHADSRAILDGAMRNAVASTWDVVRDQSIQRHVVVSPILSRALAREGGVRPLKGGAEVSASGVSRSLSAAEALSPEERSARFGLTLSEADLLLPALMVLRHFLELAGANRVLLTDVDLLTGLLGDIAMELGGVDPRAAFVAEIVGSARGIARRYGAKTAHAEHVRRIALDLFDSLRAFLDLDPRDRLLMEVAAVLHDVGRFINDRDHHKHGMYVVGWSEIIGLDERSRNVVALLVRYHRKGRPKVQHVEFGSLPTEERLRVSKLAAVLRMADAMDRGHEQRVGRIEARVRETALEIVAESAGDLSVEIAAIERKGNLFEDLTGLKVSLRRAVW